MTTPTTQQEIMNQGGRGGKNKESKSNDICGSHSKFILRINNGNEQVKVKKDIYRQSGVKSGHFPLSLLP